MSNRLIGVLLVLVCVFVEAIGQICFKQAANHAHGSRSNLSALGKVFGKWPWLSFGITCFGIEWCFWTIALSFKEMPVTVAQPMASLELIVVAMLSRAFLREKVGPRRLAGIALILGGTILVGMS